MFRVGMLDYTEGWLREGRRPVAAPRAALILFRVARGTVFATYGKSVLSVIGQPDGPPVMVLGNRWAAARDAGTPHHQARDAWTSTCASKGGSRRHRHSDPTPRPPVAVLIGELDETRLLRTAPLQRSHVHALRMQPTPGPYPGMLGPWRASHISPNSTDHLASPRGQVGRARRGRFRINPLASPGARCDQARLGRGTA